jgi:hypothetical protein
VRCAVEFSDSQLSNDGRRAYLPVGADREGNSDRALFASGATRFWIEPARPNPRNDPRRITSALDSALSVQE